MKLTTKLNLLISLFALCSCGGNNESTEQATNRPSQSYDASVIESFNEHSYGFSLGYEHGRYVLIPDNDISGQEIKSLLVGKEWAVYYDGLITLEGLKMETLDGMAEVIYYFGDGSVHIVSIPNDPTQPNDDYNEKVSFSNNLIVIGTDTLIVCSLNNGRPIFIQTLNNSAQWMYNHLEPKLN